MLALLVLLTYSDAHGIEKKQTNKQKNKKRKEKNKIHI